MEFFILLIDGTRLAIYLSRIFCIAIHRNENGYVINLYRKIVADKSEL
jgi:hypothetical protein